ncbi:MAG: hypothetical protein EAZ78_15190 [Oscillatoriales cyanobacterium]|nr:MAG: hypothetical protein EAZ78_15190 [Oscillatoriales cyanobacterium]TAF41642.1 MAG: hypothetical protein EAZ68_10320 [Oscillatoriales cyanobacterium]TAF70103.1 MAG: hypothetical protein EAZ59_06070 [Oscillatoriales cyanobacterium]
MIDWVIMGGIAIAGVGFAVGYFWDDIKAWVIRTIEYIIDQINRAINAIANAIVSLVKVGQRVYRRVEVFTMNIFTKATKRFSEQEQVAYDDIPQEIKDELEDKAEAMLGKMRS